MFFVVLFLWLNVAQDLFGLKKTIKPLYGFYIPKPKDTLTFKNWFSGNYAFNLNSSLEENFGFRNYYVRLNNQIDFSLFNKANAFHVIVGKENYLFESQYLEAFYGRDFIGTDSIVYKSKQVRSLQEALAKKNKLLIVVFAPGKASFFPEYIPDNYKSPKVVTNNEAFIQAFKKFGVNYIDLNTYFKEFKKRSKYPLFPQFGIHWSNYGAFIGADSIFRNIETRLNVDIPDIILEDVKVSSELKDPDEDILRAMNIRWYPPTYSLAYPEFKVETKSFQKKPRILVIADSYWWNIFNYGFTNDVLFQRGKFWFYYRTVYPDNYEKPTLVSNIDKKSEIIKSDVVLILHTEWSSPRMGYGFVDDALSFINNDSVPPQQLATIKKAIKDNPQWLNQIKEKASSKNLNLDSMVTLDAIWYYNNNGALEILDPIEKVKKQIVLNPQWMQQIKNKAAERKISVDSMMTLDAIWYLQNKK